MRVQRVQIKMKHHLGPVVKSQDDNGFQVFKPCQCFVMTNTGYKKSPDWAIFFTY